MKIACLLADGFEDVEALATAALLRRAKMTVDFYSVYHKKLVTGAYHTPVKVTKPMKSLNVNHYDALFIPGGSAAFSIRNDKNVQAVVKTFNDAEKWMLAICAAPTVFGMMGLMDDKHYISYPGTEKEMGNAIRENDQKAVRDGRFITGRSAGAVYDFVFEIVKATQGDDALKALKENLVY